MSNGAAREASEAVSQAGIAAPAPPVFRATCDNESSYVWNSLRRLGVRDADLEDVADFKRGLQRLSLRKGMTP